jgi:hypothetical protein
VQPGRLDIGVDDADALPGHRQQRGDIRREARLAIAAAKRVHGNELGAATLDDRGIQVLETRRAGAPGDRAVLAGLLQLQPQRLDLC